MFDYSVKFDAIDKISAKVASINEKIATMTDKSSKASNKISSKFDKSSESAQNFSEKLDGINTKLHKLGNKAGLFFSNGLKALISGGGIIAPLGQAVNAYQDIAKAQGQIGSLGIDATGIKAITAEAKKFSNTWAGTSTAEFIQASYDIKSGIASLNDIDVGKFTAIAGLTASATKSTTEEMTKLFAMGYGIYREQFKTDIEFGQQFSGAISTAVKAFRTDGSDLVSGLSTLGATATALGASLQEQLAILGTSKGSFNGASEGATSYRAFLMGAIKAQDKLNLKFTDTSGKLLPMADILDKVKNKYQKMGLSMQDAKVQGALQEAFGSVEAVKIIDALINKTDDLRKSEDLIQESMSKGTKITEEMAKAMQKGQEFDLLKQKLTNLSATIGGIFAPPLIEVADYIGKVVNKIQTWIEENPKISNIILKSVAILGGLLLALGALSIMFSVVGFALSSLTTLIAIYNGVMRIAEFVTLLFNLALWSNPLTWVVIGVMALIAVIIALIYYWEDITKWVGELWNKFNNFISQSPILQSALSAIANAFQTLSSPISFALDLLDRLLSKIELYNKLKASIGGAWTGAKNLLGFGDSIGTINNVQKNHTVVDVNLKATNAVVTDHKATTTNGRVKLNTASNGV